MNTTENEIQTLRKEIDELRNENIALHNELVKQNKILFEQVISIGKELANQQKSLHQAIGYFGGGNLHDDLKIHLTRVTAAQSAEFIIEKMPKVISFGNRNDYFRYVLDKANVSGGYLEFGVFQGESINFISSVLPNKIIYGFDAFEGLPEDWRYDSRKGDFNAGGNLPRVNKNVRLVKGWFEDTLPDFVKAHPEPCAFIHVDCDLYSSTKTIFDNLKNQIVSGTVIAFDEYFNYPGWQQGEYKAFMELVAEKNFEFEYIARTNFHQVAVKIK
ncbi:MAG: class I SAM-dependent methyltransferase [Selenomonadaceae bacterium]|nr:class I SAM-dependent methyltransferase [Selenomonadaceae bacterium]